jgi:L-iditol 2-dehydrogenase
MKAIYEKGVEVLLEKELSVPEPKDDQALVQMKAVGICGSDMHYFYHGRIGPFVVEKPMILGHECAGVVIKTGRAVKSLKEGDRVVLEPGVPCYTCDFCKAGRYNLCPDIRFFATPPVDGAFVEYVAFEENLIFKIPDEIEDFGLATMVEPMAVGVFATRYNKSPPFSIMPWYSRRDHRDFHACSAAKAAGCASVTVADIRDDRLARAKAQGADESINSKPAVYGRLLRRRYEATGADECLARAAKCMKSGGKLLLVGMGPERQTLPLVDFVCREISLLPSFRYANAYPAALSI